MKHLFFNYWKGLKYDEGILGNKTLIIGESHPCNNKQCLNWKDCTSIILKDSSNFNKECPFSDVDLCDTTINDLRNHTNGSFVINTYKNFEDFMRTSGYIGKEDKFYQYVSFVDYLQFFSPKRDIDAKWLTERDYNAVTEVVIETDPDIIIAWGRNVGNVLKKKRFESGIKGANKDYIFLLNIGVMFQFVCPERDPHFKDEPKLSVFFHTMINTNHIFIKSVIGAC